MTSAFILPNSSNHFVSHSLNSGDASFINACKTLSALPINSLCFPFILSTLPTIHSSLDPCISFTLSFNSPMRRNISPHFSCILANSAFCSSTLSSTIPCASSTALMYVVIDVTCVSRRRSVSGVSINSRAGVPEEYRGSEGRRVNIAGGVNASVPSRETYARGPSIGVSKSLGTKIAGAVAPVEAGGPVMVGNDSSDEEGVTVWERAVRRFSGKYAIRKTEVRMRIL